MLQQNPTSSVIRVDLKTELPFYLIGLPLLFLFGTLTRPNYSPNWLFALILIIVILTYNLLVYRLNAIEIDISKQTVLLIQTNLLQMHKKQSYPLGTLQFSYKLGKLSFRSRLMNICKLFVSGREVAVITPDRDGWTDKSVNDLAKALVRAGIDRKFTGYSLKDAAIKDL